MSLLLSSLFLPNTQCNECLPLYNNKPWRRGISTEANPCIICNCNNHADSCVYNATLDPFPDSFESGGGGVCTNCQDNTGIGYIIHSMCLMVLTFQRADIVSHALIVTTDQQESCHPIAVLVHLVTVTLLVPLDQSV